MHFKYLSLYLQRSIALISHPKRFFFITNVDYYKIHNWSKCSGHGLPRPISHIYLCTAAATLREHCRRGAEDCKGQRTRMSASRYMCLLNITGKHPWNLNSMVAETRPAEWHHQLMCQHGWEVSQGSIPRWAIGWERENQFVLSRDKLPYTHVNMSNTKWTH